MTRLAPITALVLALNVMMLRVVYAESIPLKSHGGTFVVPVLINGKIPLDFILDSGAAEVTIPADVFRTLLRTETISEDDLLQPGEYVLADGSTRREPRFRIRSLQVGNLELRNVAASVGPMQGPLLLGQSFLSRMRTWSVDNQRHLLVIDELRGAQPEQEAYQVSTISTHSAAVTNAGASDSSGDIWYECMKEHEWRDEAKAGCGSSAYDVHEPVATSQPSSGSSSARGGISADRWYECMKRNGWRDEAKAGCGSSAYDVHEPAAASQPSSGGSSATGSFSADRWYECMKRNGWRDEANDACSKATSTAALAPDEATRQ